MDKTEATVIVIAAAGRWRREIEDYILPDPSWSAEDKAGLQHQADQIEQAIITLTEVQR